MQKQSLAGNWEFQKADQQEWLPATVPGGVHTDLVDNGKIPDPFDEDNELKVQWVAESDWEYRHTFAVSPEILAEDQVWLVCDGLDTLANVLMNGHFLGHTENMFRQYRWDVKSLLTPEPNVIGITFESPIRYITPRQDARPMLGVSQAIPGGPYLRKAPCQFGWDWGPQLPPIGIWKDISLEGYSSARFEDVHLRQLHRPEGVTVQASFRLEKWDEEALTIHLTVSPPGGEATIKVIQIEGLEGEVSVLINDPNGEFIGPQYYDVGDCPLSVFSADFNGDQFADLAVANENLTQALSN